MSSLCKSLFLHHTKPKNFLWLITSVVILILLIWFTKTTSRYDIHPVLSVCQTKDNHQSSSQRLSAVLQRCPSASADDKHKREENDERSSSSVYSKLRSTSVSPDELDKLYNVAIELHVIWCSSSQFNFTNYLSIKSAIDVFRPALVHVHCRATPGRNDVFDWYTDMMLLYPLIKIHVAGRKLCPLETTSAADYLLSLVDGKHNQILMTAETLLLPHPNWRHLIDDNNYLSANVFVGTGASYQMLQTIFGSRSGGVQFIRCLETCIDQRGGEGGEMHSNVTDEQITDGQQQADSISVSCCLSDASLTLNYVLGRTFIQNEKEIVALRRLIYEKNGGHICPTYYDSDVIPRIAHYVVNSGISQMDYAFYLSVLSVLHVVQVECVYFHGNVMPSGDFWNKLLKGGRCVRWINWPMTSEVWGHAIRWSTQQDDILRTEILSRYGGLMLDRTVYFNKPLPEELWRFDTVLSSLAIVDESVPFNQQDDIVAHVYLSRPSAAFFQRFMDRQKRCYEPGTGGLYSADTYSSNAQMSNVYRRNPTLAYVMPNLMTYCEQLNGCLISRSDLSDGDGERRSQYKPDCLMNDVFAFHFAEKALPPEFANPSTMMKASPLAFGRRLIESLLTII